MQNSQAAGSMLSAFFFCDFSVGTFVFRGDFYGTTGRGPALVRPVQTQSGRNSSAI
jgi:hypothetical protein